MSGQIPRPRSVTLVATLLAWSISVAALTITARADDCLAEPNSPAPAGSHWYYHFDKTTQRKCWYIHAKDQSVQPAAAQATSDPASLPPAAAIPLEKPAPASASDPTSISSGDSAPSRVKVPAVKPQRASVSGTATDQSVQQATPQAGPALSIQTPAPQASQSSQTSDQGATTRSVPAPAWPDPAIATFKAQERTAPSSDSPTEFIQPTADTTAGTSVSDDAKNTATGGVSPTNTAGTTTFASTMRVEMFAIIALGLVVAGILLRVVMKISVMKIFSARRQGTTIDHHDFDRIDDLAHELDQDQYLHQRDALSEYLQRSKIPAAIDSKPRQPSRLGNDRPDVTRARDSVSQITKKRSIPKHRRIDVDPPESEWGDDRPPHLRSDDQQQRESGNVDARQHEGRNDQLQHGSVSEADELIHDLQSSLTAAASDYRPRPALDAADESSESGRGKDDGSQIGDEIREDEEVLERLRRDLDRLLQSPKVA